MDVCDKKPQRRVALERRNELSVQARALFSLKICERLLSLPELSSVKTVLAYKAMPGEADLAALCNELGRRGVTVAYPRVEGRGVLNAYAPGGSDSFILSTYGIWEPSPETSTLIAPESLDAVLTPCLAFDGDLNRLGHGGGYYDRYFLRCPRALRICVAFEAQRLPAISHDEYDIPMHIAVTEAGILYSSRLSYSLPSSSCQENTPSHSVI